MIAVRLTGGLGNQMFQYAAGRALAYRLGTELALDCSSYRREWLHSYALDHFKIAGHVEPVRRNRRRLRGATGGNGLPVVREVQGVLCKDLFQAGDNVYLHGYWQSPRYFEDIAVTLRSEFTPRAPLSGPDANLAARIAASNAVCVHVRRGDYVTVGATNRLFGTCSPDYYRRAMHVISRQVERPCFFVFSNDPAWARQHVRGEQPVVHVTHNYRRRHTGLEGFRLGRAFVRLFKALYADRGYRDLHLMSLCRHFIVANSTFSWWAAWLGRSPDKIVCVPRSWFAPRSDDPDGEQEMRRDFEHLLIPSGWRRV